MRILFATTNQNKLSRINKLIGDTHKLISLDELLKDLGEPEETEPTCVGIAAQKALYYVERVDSGLPVLTQDDTIRFEDVEASDQPGTSIKKPVVERYGEFSDEKALQYYTDLVEKYGGHIQVTFEYGHAAAVKNDNDRESISLVSALSTLSCRLATNVKNQDKYKGYFLAAMMEVKIQGKWKHYTELSDEELVEADTDLRDSIISLLGRVI